MHSLGLPSCLPAYLFASTAVSFWTKLERFSQDTGTSRLNLISKFKILVWLQVILIPNSTQGSRWGTYFWWSGSVKFARWGKKKKKWEKKSHIGQGMPKWWYANKLPFQNLDMRLCCSIRNPFSQELASKLIANWTELFRKRRRFFEKLGMAQIC